MARGASSMGRQRIFEVTPEQSGWVVRDNIGLYVTRHRTSDEAISEGHRIAAQNAPCRLIIKSEAGDTVYDQELAANGS